uniref:Uncharacterized protein n=1 Tax=Arundo donax TaxID=35708 RepID=A0A0A9EEF0_ARUDO
MATSAGGGQSRRSRLIRDECCLDSPEGYR